MSNAAASRLHLGPYDEAIVTAAAQASLAEIGGHVSCAIVFVSADYRPHLREFLELVQVHGHVPLIVGCSGRGLIGTEVEAEVAVGFSWLFLHLPETRLLPVTIPDGESGEAFKKEAGLRIEGVETWIALVNPFTVDVEDWLEAWNTAFPKVPCLGGMGSGGMRGDEVFCFQNRELVEGGVALGFQGGVRIATLVSQGCRPIGEPLTITGVEGNEVLTLGAKPTLQVLEELLIELSEVGRQIEPHNVLAGLASTEYVDEFKTGDFVVRNFVSGDRDRGSLGVAALPRVGQTMQFQLRDRASADTELRRLTAELAATVQPFASLLFACGGRGERLFGTPHHDASLLAERFGAKPGAGFFCNGEIGPVGGKNFVHGYTASIALFH